MMTSTKRIKNIAFAMNILDILGIFVILAVALIFQFVFYDLPCPLCLLQRLGMLGIALGISMNFRFGLRASHYAVSCISALYLAAVAIRQILLHIAPGVKPYGPAVLGMHMYTWAFIIAAAFIAFTVLGLFLNGQFATSQFQPSPLFKKIAFTLLILVLCLSIVNTGAVFTECGFSQCPDNPIHYLY